MSPDFNKAQNLATELLLKQSLDSLFIDIRNFTFDKNIHIDTFQNYCRVTRKNISDFNCVEMNGSCTIKSNRKTNIILYDDSQTHEQRKHWGIMHEVGHIYLEHTTDDDVSEIEANFFAAQVVTPEILLFELLNRKHELNYIDIYNNFNVSLESALKRRKTLSNKVFYNYNIIDLKLREKMLPLLPTFA